MEVESSQSLLRLKQCPNCSYDLRGLLDSRNCPECGVALDLAVIDLPVWTNRSRRYRVISLIVTGAAALLLGLAWFWFKVQMGCMFIVLLCYSGTLIMGMVRATQVRRAQANAVLLFKEDGMVLAERGKAISSIPYENLIIMSLRPRGRRFRFRITDRRWFTSDKRFECLAFISPAEGEELLRIIKGRCSEAQ